MSESIKAMGGITENSLNEYEKFIRTFVPENLTQEQLPTFLSEKRSELRVKYGMPDRQPVLDGKEKLEEYHEKLLLLAGEKEIGVASDFEEYAQKHHLPGGANACFGDDTDNKIHIIKDFNPNDVPDVKSLEHELVHALQYKNEPGMPIEQKEFEAYLVADGLDYIFQNPSLRDIFFSLIKSSVDSYKKFAISTEG